MQLETQTNVSIPDLETITSAGMRDYCLKRAERVFRGLENSKPKNLSEHYWRLHNLARGAVALARAGGEEYLNPIIAQLDTTPNLDQKSHGYLLMAEFKPEFKSKALEAVNKASSDGSGDQYILGGTRINRCLALAELGEKTALDGIEEKFDREEKRWGITPNLVADYCRGEKLGKAELLERALQKIHDLKEPPSRRNTTYFRERPPLDRAEQLELADYKQTLFLSLITGMCETGNFDRASELVVELTHPGIKHISEGLIAYHRNRSSDSVLQGLFDGQGEKIGIPPKYGYKGPALPENFYHRLLTVCCEDGHFELAKKADEHDFFYGYVDDNGLQIIQHALRLGQPKVALEILENTGRRSLTTNGKVLGYAMAAEAGVKGALEKAINLADDYTRRIPDDISTSIEIYSSIAGAVERSNHPPHIRITARQLDGVIAQVDDLRHDEDIHQVAINTVVVNIGRLLDPADSNIINTIVNLSSKRSLDEASLWRGLLSVSADSNEYQNVVTNALERFVELAESGEMEAAAVKFWHEGLRLADDPRTKEAIIHAYTQSKDDTVKRRILDSLIRSKQFYGVKMALDLIATEEPDDKVQMHFLELLADEEFIDRNFVRDVDGLSQDLDADPAIGREKYLIFVQTALREWGVRPDFSLWNYHIFGRLTNVRTMSVDDFGKALLPPLEKRNQLANLLKTFHFQRRKTEPVKQSPEISHHKFLESAISYLGGEEFGRILADPSVAMNASRFSEIAGNVSLAPERIEEIKDIFYGYLGEVLTQWLQGNSEGNYLNLRDFESGLDAAASRLDQRISLRVAQPTASEPANRTEHYKKISKALREGNVATVFLAYAAYAADDPSVFLEPKGTVAVWNRHLKTLETAYRDAIEALKWTG